MCSTTVLPEELLYEAIGPIHTNTKTVIIVLGLKRVSENLSSQIKTQTLYSSKE